MGAQAFLFPLFFPIIQLVGLNLTRYVLPLPQKYLQQFLIEVLGISASQLPYYAVFFSFLLTYVSFWPSLFYTVFTEDKLDNSTPRVQKASQTGFGARATGAHQNALESFPAFAVAVILFTLLVDEPSETTSNIFLQCCLLYLVARVLFHVFYLLNFGAFRSLSFGLGFWCIIFIFCLALRTSCTTSWLQGSGFWIPAPGNIQKVVQAGLDQALASADQAFAQAQKAMQ